MADTPRPGTVAPERAAAAKVFGRRLRALRGARTQADIAAAAHISRVYLSELERGLRPRPSRTTLTNLSKAVGFSMDEVPGYLLHGPDQLVEDEVSATGVVGVVGVVDTPPQRSTLTRPADPRTAAEEGDSRGPPPGNRAEDPPDHSGPTFRVYRSGTRGDPRDPQEAPMPLALERVPVGREGIVGPRGFGIIVRGEQLRGWRIHDGDLCVINPEVPVRRGRLIGAEVETDEGEAGVGVYELAETPEGVAVPAGTERRWLLTRPDRQGEPVYVAARSFTVLGPVVGVMTWRSPDEGRAGEEQAPPVDPTRVKRLGAAAVERQYERGRPIAPRTQVPEGE